jgi:acetyl-CoA carboxylase biotin carboxyl carrier protein
MKLSESEILHILKMVEESSFGELRLETGELKLLVRKKGYNPAIEHEFQAERPGSGASLNRQSAVQAPPAVPKERPRQMEAGQEGLVPIKAPMLGTVYRRPSPDAPPYADVGSFVKEEDTVCLIEVMKVFTAVKAGIRGHVSQVLIETNDMVEYNQPMFLVKPAAGIDKTDK